MTVFCGKRGDQVICFHIASRIRLSVPFECFDHPLGSSGFERIVWSHPYPPCPLMGLGGEVSLVNGCDTSGPDIYMQTLAFGLNRSKRAIFLPYW